MLNKCMKSMGYLFSKLDHIHGQLRQAWNFVLNKTWLWSFSDVVMCEISFDAP